MRECYADLHLHTTASDGTQGIHELITRAGTFGLSIIAITDHDTIADVLTDRVARINGIEVITGVEIKVDFDGVPGELLGYFVAPATPSLQELFLFMRHSRVERMAQMVERCRQHMGLEISPTEVSALATGSIGRPHLARLLVEKGVVPSLREAFNRLIGKGSPCYIPLARPDFREAIQAVHTAGGVVSIAHPCLMDIEDWERFLSTMRSEGVDGIEVFYPYELAHGGLALSPSGLTTLAKKHNFLLTGGSDDHGPASSKETLGALRIPCHYVEAIRRACGLS